VSTLGKPLLVESGRLLSREWQWALPLQFWPAGWREQLLRYSTAQDMTSSMSGSTPAEPPSIRDVKKESQ
jgi:hypothetical protein